MESFANLLPRLLTLGNVAALALFFACLLGMTRLIEHSSDARPSTSRLMARYRRRWMQETPNRANRMLDAALLISLRNGAAFFASGAIIAIGGAMALLGQTERLLEVAEDFAVDIEASTAEWEAKLLFIVFLMISAFLKFVWAHRLFGYCAILMGATADDGPSDQTAVMVERGAKLNIAAGRSFNRGLRTLYFTMAAVAWFLGPVALGAASLLTASMLYRREFLSDSRRALLAGDTT